MRIKIVIFLIFIILFAAGFYYYNHADLVSVSDASEKVTIGNIGEYSIPNLIAKEKGYFKNNGLDANVIEYPSGPPAVADLISGKVDIAVAADFVGVKNIFDNKDLRILAELDKHEDFQMSVRKAAGISGVGDLRGKKIGVTLGGAGEFFLGRFLGYNGLTIKDVHIVNLPPDEIVKQIESGQIDVCVVFSVHTFKIQQNLGDKVVVWPIQRSRRIFAIAYTTETFIRNYSDIPYKYLRSVLEAEAFLKSHPEESKAILEKVMNYDTDYIRYIWPRFDFSIGLDQEFLLSLEDNARFIIDNNLTKERIVPNYLNYIYFDALSKVSPDTVTIDH